MSFSSKIKEELDQKIPAARHCLLAELSALLLFNMKYYNENGEMKLVIRSENEGTIRKCFTILEKAFNIERVLDIVQDRQSITLRDSELVRRILQAVKQWDDENGYLERGSADNRLLTHTCCRRAFIRGCFLSAGSVSSPEKFYHFEIVCAKETLAQQLQSLFSVFEIDAKIVQRKRYYVVYLKEGDQISDTLNLMEAPIAVMDFENVRVLKDVRNRVNRSVNCETANINKTAAAAAAQLEAITYLRDTIGLEELPEGLAEIARVRLDMPEASLVELGESLSPPVGKSGVNHRLRKLKALADQHRKNHSDWYSHEANKEEK